MKFTSLFCMGDLVTHAAVVHPYTFVITYDKTLNVYGASWAPLEDPSAQEFIGDDVHPEVGLPHFKTMDEAVRACEQQLKELSHAQDTNQSA